MPRRCQTHSTHWSPPMKLDKLEMISRARVWGAKDTQKVKESLPSLIAEVKAARAWLAAHAELREFISNGNSKGYDATVGTYEKARDGYRDIVKEHSDG